MKIDSQESLLAVSGRTAWGKSRESYKMFSRTFYNLQKARALGIATAFAVNARNAAAMDYERKNTERKESQ